MHVVSTYVTFHIRRWISVLKHPQLWRWFSFIIFFLIIRHLRQNLNKGKTFKWRQISLTRAIIFKNLGAWLDKMISQKKRKKFTFWVCVTQTKTVENVVAFIWEIDIITWTSITISLLCHFCTTFWRFCVNGIRETEKDKASSIFAASFFIISQKWFWR